MELSLNGRAGIVTGAAQGLGRAMVDALLASGASVSLVDRDQPTLAAVREELARHGERTHSQVTDVSDAAALRRAVDAAAERFGRLDFLINNAGIREIAPFRDYSLEAWERTIAINLTAPFVASQAAIPHFLAQGKGKIVNVASAAGELALRNRVAYNVTKAGLVMLTKTICFELASEGIMCNAVAPGVVETPLAAAYFEDEDMTRVIVENTPLGRWGQPPEIAAAVVFLCSDAADFIQGHTLTVDGGWVAGKGY